MHKTMNHPSEWAKCFDERTGHYRYKHKGSGLVRDTLMSIEKTFKKGATNVAKKLYEAPLRKLAKSSPKRWLKKGLIKYNEYYKTVDPKHQPRNQLHELPAKHQPRKSRREMQ